MKVSELQLPATVEYIRHLDNRGALMSTVRIVDRKGRNVLTDEGNWLWWPTMNHFGEARVVPDEAKGKANG